MAEPSDYYTAAAFESLFGDTTAASATLTETWQDETVTAMEVNSAQLAQLLDEDMEHAYLINTAHRIEVDWLYVSEDFYQSAGEELQAAMKEASAYALAYVDARPEQGLRGCLCHPAGKRPAHRPVRYR